MSATPIDIKWKSHINKVKRFVKKSSDAQQELFDMLATAMKIKEGSDEYEALWDHVFNDTDWTIRYKK